MRAQVMGVAAAVLLAATGAAAQPGGAACDREYLIRVAEQYLDALVATDPKRPALAGAAVRYTENGQRLALGDGLWNSISARGTYKIHVADPVAGQIVTFITTPEAGTPITLALRPVEKGLLHGIEATLERVPYGMGSGWSSWEDAMSDKMQWQGN
jgi:hypothetical protein